VGGGIKATRHCGHQWPIVPAPGDYDNGEIGGIIGRGNRSTRRKPAPVPLCPPQTPYAARTRTRTAAVGSQRLTAELRHRLNLRNIKSSVFRDITSCVLLKSNRYFGGTHRRHLHGWRMTQARNQHETSNTQISQMCMRTLHLIIKKKQNTAHQM
jgi:hypothetical protein